MSTMPRSPIRAFATVAVVLFAASLPVVRAQTPVADAAHGEQLAVNSVPPCASCHGPDGAGMPAAGFPRIVDHSPEYIAKQLSDFASGTRASPIMGSIAKALSAQDIADVSTYYAEKSHVGWTAEKADAKLILTGKTIANLGDAKAGVQACGNCHGPDGRGEAPYNPPLRGQSAAYITAQLNAWRQGTRHNDSGELMSGLAKRLTPADITAVSAYFASLPAPKTAD
jgi:cytochrome c553